MSYIELGQDGFNGMVSLKNVLHFSRNKIDKKLLICYENGEKVVIVYEDQNSLNQDYFKLKKHFV